MTQQVESPTLNSHTIAPSPNSFPAIDIRWFPLEPLTTLPLNHKLLIAITQTSTNYIWSYLQDMCLFPNILRYIEGIFKQFQIQPKSYTMQGGEGSCMLEKYLWLRWRMEKGKQGEQEGERRRWGMRGVYGMLKERVGLGIMTAKNAPEEFQKIVAEVNCRTDLVTGEAPRYAWKGKMWEFGQVVGDVMKKKILGGSKRVGKEVRSKNSKKWDLNEKGVQRDPFEVLIAYEQNLKLLGCLITPKLKSKESQIRIPKKPALKEPKFVNKEHEWAFFYEKYLKNCNIQQMVGIYYGQSAQDKRQVLHMKVRKTFKLMTTLLARQNISQNP